jgi:GNAT superfamily N-acetyltransferase
MRVVEERRDLVVAEASAADAGELRALLLAANEEHRASMPPRVFARYLDDLVELVGEVPPAGMLVAREAGGRLVGTGTVLDQGSLHALWPAGTVVLRAMAVLPEARGTGAGGAIGRACLARAASLGAVAVGLHTGPFMVDAMRLYESLGFRRCPEVDLPIDDIFGPAGEPYDDPALGFRLELR